MKKITFYCRTNDEKNFYKKISRAEKTLKKDFDIEETEISNTPSENKKVGFIK